MDIQKIKFLALGLVLIVLAGCEEEGEVTGFNIRLYNGSSYKFENIIVNTSNGNTSYADLNARNFSAYQSFDYAYRYAFIELTIEGSVYTLQPIDYVGEKKLPEGNYTYRIDVPDLGDQFGSLSLELIEN